MVRGRRVLVREQGQVYSRWQFEDVDVSGAWSPTSRYYFRAMVPGLGVTSNAWGHGADGRTYFPAQDVPASSGLDCPQ